MPKPRPKLRVVFNIGGCKPDARRLLVLERTTVAHRRAKEPVTVFVTTVLARGKLYPYNSVKRGWPKAA
jgi:hypothetical protein